jgi:hypothetical protein
VRVDLLSYVKFSLCLGACKEIEETNKEEKKTWWM